MNAVRLPARRTLRDDSAERTFALHVKAYELPECVPQYKLTSPHLMTPKTNKRKTWVFDFAFPGHALLVEVDGGVWVRGAHGHPLDILRNMQKQNDAVALGWAVLRFTPQQVQSGEAVQFTRSVLHQDAPRDG